MVRWSEKETGVLKELFKLGYGDREIAEQLPGRTAWSIGKRRRRLGLRTYGQSPDDTEQEQIIPRLVAKRVSRELLKRLVIHHREKTPGWLKREIIAVTEVGRLRPTKSRPCETNSGCGQSATREDLATVDVDRICLCQTGKCAEGAGADGDSLCRFCRDNPATGAACLTLRELARTIAENHSVTIASIVGDVRTKGAVLARQELYFQLRCETEFSYPQIGRLVGGRDHSSVLHGVKRHAKRVGAAYPGKNGPCQSLIDQPRPIEPGPATKSADGVST